MAADSKPLYGPSTTFPLGSLNLFLTFTCCLNVCLQLQKPSNIDFCELLCTTNDEVTRMKHFKNLSDILTYCMCTFMVFVLFFIYQYNLLFYEAERKLWRK